MTSSEPTAVRQFVEDLWAQVLEHLAGGAREVLLLGAGTAALELTSRLHGLALEDLRVSTDVTDPGVDVVVICEDESKEDLLRELAAAASSRQPEVVLAGMGHMRFRDRTYDQLDAPAMVPSYATGYPNTRIHIFQCLRAAARSGLSGAVVELGAFKGGTTVWLAKVVAELGLDSRVIGLDSWDGFPPRRSVLDLYGHPRCEFRERSAVHAYTEPHGIDLIAGDISDTAEQLRDIPVLLCFVDTDNYSPARAALEVIADNVVRGGAVVFDHYTTSGEYLYTIGERMAGQDALLDRDFLHLHDTGVFIRL